MPDQPELNLGSIANGAAFELFERELNRVLGNIKDPNTSAQKKRKISLIFEFTPYNDRSGAAMEVKVKSELIATTGVNASIYIGRVGQGLFRAFSNDTRQNALNFDESDGEDGPQNVAPGTRTPQ